jgi:hypothetical protein
MTLLSSHASASALMGAVPSSERLLPRLQKSLAALLQTEARLAEAQTHLFGPAPATNINSGKKIGEDDIQAQSAEQLICHIEAYANRLMDEAQKLAQRI